METKRVSSARMQRHTRARSSSIENQTLRDSLNASQIQLQKCEADLKKTKEQLQCLIHMVKRAWTGDIEASVHVANIVGVAPPNLEVRGDTDELIAVPKSAALNNWACLTIGLLNKVYIQQEQERKFKQLTYLNTREKFLDKQLGGFLQDPSLRSTEDVASSISRQMLRKLKEDQDTIEKSNVGLREQIKKQKDKLSEKQAITRPHHHKRETHSATETSQHKIQNNLDSDLTIEASGVKVKEASSEKNTNERVEQGHLKKAKSTIEKPLAATASTTKPPRPKTSRPFEGSDFKVQISKRSQRPFSAKMAPLSKTKSMMITESKRRKSLESSFRREEYKLDQIERELKKTTSQLQRKLNIDPKGFLNFR